MNRYFFRLPRGGEYYYTPAILVVSPSLEYYWERRGESSTNGQHNGVLTPGEEAILTGGGTYLELRPDSNSEFILNRMAVGDHTADNWCEALTPYAVASSPFPKRPYSRLKTNHKLGAPKGNLP